MPLSEDEFAAEFRRLWDDPVPIAPPPPLVGLEPCVLSARQIRLDLKNPEASSITALLKWLPPERELFFWDCFYPQLSDPGAGVQVQRDKERFAHKVGNHGWSSNWQLQSLEVLVAWIMLNAEARSPHQPLKAITLSSARSYWLAPRASYA